MLEYRIQIYIYIGKSLFFKSGNQKIVFCLPTINWWISTQCDRSFRFHYCCPFRFQWNFKKTNIQWLVSALPKCPYSAKALFWLRACKQAISSFPAQLWKPLCWVYSRPLPFACLSGVFTAQWPQQVLPMASLFFKTTPNQDLQRPLLA